MHQPFYRDTTTGDCVQPWVRLHGIHSYYDMLKLYEEFGDICTNINFVPSLLKQLRAYTENNASDKFLEYTLVDAKELNPTQKMFILRNFFMINPDRLIRPYPRYWKLYNQRGVDISKIDFQDAIRYFSWKDYLDIQVYYNLVWFGFKAREDFPEIARMLSNASSGHIFTEEDKKAVINIQREVLKKLMGMIKNLPANIELTTTPFFHPILPLVLDTDLAKRCMPKATLPPRVTLPKHADFQVRHGLDYFEETVGKKASGVWPAEGSVCPEMIPILESNGVKWVATDEGILAHSGVKGKREEYLYQPYIAEQDGHKVTMVFRDRELSDLIGFSYAKMPPDAAVRDFMSKLKTAVASAKQEYPLITILLDGENAWESYEDHGRPFLTGLLTELRKSGLKTATVSNYLAEHPAKNNVPHLATGSWINSDFGIWIGKPQKNKAWSYIKESHDGIAKKLDTILSNPERSAQELNAIETFGAACGSDWFWWFDDDFSSEFKADFDKIFRMHLKNTFTLLGRDIPVFLYEPIFKYEESPRHSHGPLSPQAFTYPKIDGLNTSFFEWTNAVCINISGDRGTMAQTGTELIETIHFGFNPENFYLRLDSLRKDVTFSLLDDEEIVIYLHDKTAKYKLRLFFDKERYQLKFVDSPEEGYSNSSHKVEFAVRQNFEMGLNFKDLGFTPGEHITIIVTVVRKDIEVRHYSHMMFVVPDETYERQMWTV